MYSPRLAFLARLSAALIELRAFTWEQWHPVTYEDALIIVANPTWRRELADDALNVGEISIEDDVWVFSDDIFSD